MGCPFFVGVSENAPTTVIANPQGEAIQERQAQTLDRRVATRLAMTVF